MTIRRASPLCSAIACAFLATAHLAAAQSNRVSIAACQATWKLGDNHISNLAFIDTHHHTLTLGEPFLIRMADGSTYAASTMRVIGTPTRTPLPINPNAPRAAEHLAGTVVTTELQSEDGRLHATWSVLARSGTSYLRETLTLQATRDDLPIANVTLIDAHLPGATVSGTVKGSPIIAGDVYLGFEHPLSTSAVTNGHATANIARVLPLRAGQSITYSAVMGVTHPGQLRRDFLAYIETERAHPYRTFLHYNSWYDLGFFSPYNEAGALDRINAFGTELHNKRGVTLDSFLFDDGWDDHKTLWRFHPTDFPNGFNRVREAAAQYGTAPGVWMSPWGGYGQPKKDRVAMGQQQGYETIRNGFALSGPRYYERFREVAFNMVRNYGINQFKIDGTGNADSVVPGSAFDSDFSAALHLIGELRALKPDLYINLTTGTYPSPFWLMTADSIWRGGEDDDVAGVGPYRERWITYRDADTYKEVVKAGPLFPLNSVMLHGLIYAQHHKQLKADPTNSFRNEVRSYFGTGTQLQELYITPSLLTQQNWDDLAESAKWSRNNAGTLKDTHWIGGDPAALQVYGWAAWSPQHAILTLRNPSDKPGSITLDPQQAFELPASAPRTYSMHSPYNSDSSNAPIQLRAGQPHTFQLQPFEVITLEATTGPS